MSRHKITQEELKGFSLEKYSSLAKFSYGQWANLISHRSMLWKLPQQPAASSVTIPQAMTDAFVAETITALLTNPLGGFHTSPRFIGGGSPLNTASIRLRIQPYTGPMPAPSGNINGDLFGTLDGVPLGQATVDESQAHTRRVLLEVDIDTPNVELIRDFAMWLRQWRTLSQEPIQGTEPTASMAWAQTTIKRWIDIRLVAYIDLKLIGKLYQKDFGADALRRLIFPKHSEGEWAAAERKQKRLCTEFFRGDTLDLMGRLAFNEGRGSVPNL